jgi:hypothetical protein
LYPNGILYAEGDSQPADERTGIPEIAFVASRFYSWHGLEALLDSMAGSGEEALLHLVGTLPATVGEKASRDSRVRLHGPLGRSELEALIGRCWVGLSSFGLNHMGMSEACTLKVREYLRSGLPVYAGHLDSALPINFAYFRHGNADWTSIVEYARYVRRFDRTAVARAARPFIDKKILLAALHSSLADRT